VTTVFPADAEELIALQRRLAREADAAPPWRPPPDRPLRAAGVFAAAARGLAGAGARGDPAWAAAAVLEGRRLLAWVALRGEFDAPYRPGLLALRVGRLLERAVRGLGVSPDLLLVDATGRDHPRRAGLALHLGAALGLPSIGVTDRPLLASGPEPGSEAGELAELRLQPASRNGPPAEPDRPGGELVGYRLRSRRRTRPIVVHAGWRVGPELAAAIVAGLVAGSRTPEPLRQARRLARSRRGGDAAGLLDRHV
jgi:deoxyribonuclease V